MIIIPSNCASAIPSDPSWPYVSLLVKDIGINGATNNSFYDDGPYKFLPARNGDVTQGSFSPFVPTGYWSNYFDGTAGVTYPSSSNYTPGTGDFSVEGWIYPTQWGSAWGMFFADVNYGLYVGTIGSNFVIRSSGVGDVLQCATLPSLNAWTHVVACRTGTTLSLYYNGTRVASMTSAYNFYGVGVFRIGNFSGEITYGNISNLRMVNGRSVYDATSSTLTIPTAPLTAVAGTSLLTFQDNRHRDASSNNATPTVTSPAPAVSRLNPFGPSLPAPTVNLASAGSITSTDSASGSYMTVPASSNWVFSGDYTIEAWVMHKTTNPLVVWATGGLGSSDQFTIGPSSSSTATDGFCFWSYGLDGGQIASALTIPTGQWYHVAVSRVGSTLRMFINGTVVATKTGATSTIGRNGTGYIGARSNFEYPLFGNISNLRIVNGTGLYTTNFTPSTSPLTAVANTVLLTCQDGATVTDASSNNYTVTKVGNAVASEASPFKRVTYPYGGSAYFDGSGDYLTCPSNSGAFGFGAGDFTVEAWICPNSTGSSQAIVGGSYGGFTFRLGANYGGNLNGLQITRSMQADHDNCSYTFTPGQWYHVAVVRQSGVNSFFINGIKQTTGNTGSAGYSWPSETAWTVGAASNPSYEPYSGYMSNVRVVKGVAVYTANFTPPVAPVSAVGGTSLLLNFDNAGIYDGSGNKNLTISTGTKLSTTSAKFGLAAIVPETAGYPVSVAGTNADLSFGTGDFTIETWFNTTNASAIQMLFDSRPQASYDSYPLLYISSGALSYYMNSGVRITGGTVSSNTWNHVAICRSSGTTRMFLNGTKVGSDYADTNVYSGSTGRPVIGGQGFSADYWLQGYLEDFRITKGVARYTSTFTPPAIEAATQKG